MSSENLEIVHEGWLTKSPPSKRVLKAVSVKLKWRRRWFVLRHSGELPGQYFLAYYTDKSRRKMKGRIDLDQCEQVDAGLRFEDRKSKYHYMFDIKTPKRTYYLAAESEDDMNKWVDFVCHVCGLKPFTVDENSEFESSVNNIICRPFPINTEEQEEEHSSPDSPISISSSHYIPISECISGKPLLPIHPNGAIEESYDLPRRLRPTPRLSESPPPSPGSESVFTDDDSISGCNISRPSVNWQTFPRLSQNSPDLPIAANRRFTKIGMDGQLAAPPRPPKPSHLLETSIKSEKSFESTVGDETYDFPRSHQMSPPQAQPRAHRRHCYSNAAPGQVTGNIFTYDFVEENGQKNEDGKNAESDSPCSTNSPSAIANISSASLEQTPPAINRQLKPGRKFSDTSAELSPLTPLANPPIVNRRLKPTQIRKTTDMFYASTLKLCAPPAGSLNRRKSRMGPNAVPTNFEPLSRIHRRHSASDDRLASDKVSSYQMNKISSNSRYLAEASRFNDIQYLDLEFESSDKSYSTNNRSTSKTPTKKKNNNVGGHFTLVSMHDYSMIDGAYPYKTVDFLKTAALSMSRKRAEQERRLGQNMVN
ncbi:protein daughter of sevenless isoform X2 [Daktulosphaira vitifoliae]|uniref:protein daughter of sevenless isoform X2 n=1 Tax=Daktulosphaira vitifoliae TaxID=58002 RepID=UPI0021AA68D3|nr:protein daughter of sevenless isoform X2 [Daktulosphaira vitifoliae]